MKTRPTSFSLTDPTAYDGKAPIFTVEELYRFPPPTWLIDGLVPNSAMVGLVGAPGVGKSMLALDWGLCVATGRSWLGHAVDRGFVLYIAAEGHAGLAVRAKAWCRHHDIHPARARFGLVRGRLSIKAADPNAFKDEKPDYDILFDRIDTEVRKKPKLIIIDTLARCLDGNENENEGMGGFLDGAERLVERYDSTVLVVHHKNATGNRERGHTSFRGTVGAMFFFDRVPRSKDLLVLKNEKQRDAREAADLGLKMTEEGDSAVLELADLPASSAKRGEGLPQVMRKSDMLKLLAASENGYTGEEWRLASGVPRSTFFKRAKQLLADGEIFKENGRYFVVPALTDIAELGRDDE